MARTEIKKDAKTSEEAYAYAPGLKVKRATVISKTRQLPIPGEVYVKIGDKVNCETVIAKTQIPGDPVLVNASAELGVEADELSTYMTKNVGDHVHKNEPIAIYKAFFGAINKQAVSPADGVIESVSEVTGQVVVRSMPVRVQVDAYIPGIVTKILPGEGATIETSAALIQGIFGLGGENHGSITMVANSPDEELTAENIIPEHKSMVLVGGSMVTLDALKKAADIGVACIVSGGIKHDDVAAFLGEQIGVAITGEEKLGLTLIITEGFGKMRMSQRTFGLLKSLDSRMASVNGATQIRAGVVRPEIIIPHEEGAEQVSGDELAAGMIPGTHIRMIRQPYFGALGKVVGLPTELQEVESESYVRVLEVKLEDGRVVTVPRANVEIIEE